MRRFDPAGKPSPADYTQKRVDEKTVVKTANLSPESRGALATIDLHFHALRREAGSRWMDAGVPLATIQRWLGHTNMSQTSTYLTTPIGKNPHRP